MLAETPIDSTNGPRVPAQLMNDLEDLFSRNRHGHMGHWEYIVPNGPSLWDSFINNHPLYYIPEEEQKVIKTALPHLRDHVSGPVSIISLGPGSLVVKDINIAECFDVRSFHLIDRSDKILADSAERVTLTHPNWHVEIHKGDFYEGLPETPHRPVIIMCGQTLFNVEGPAHEAPRKKVVNNLKALHKPDATFIMPQDATSDELKIRNAYAGQKKFALNVLDQAGYDKDGAFDFDVLWHPKTGCLAHLFTRAQSQWHFNSSWKFMSSVFADVAQEAGWQRQACYGHNGMTLPVLQAG